jgi:hypothetical protein
MCESMLLADGLFEPIRIKSNKIQFKYNDKVLIKQFEMDITITKASVTKITDQDGKTIAYEFRVE